MDFAGLAQIIIFGYIAVVLTALGIALVMPKRWFMKTLAAALVLIVFVGPFINFVWHRESARTAAKARYQESEALFQERCKTAGTKVIRTDANVAGILLMRLRPQEINFGQQFLLDDPYGHDFGGKAYIESFLRGFAKPRPTLPYRLGYLYVEAIDMADGKRYRYVGVTVPVRRKDTTSPEIQKEIERNPNYDLNIYEFQLRRTEAPSDSKPRYGITYDDISTRADREHWIAGSSLRIVDLESNETIAERIGYMMDRGQGSGAGDRSPWLFAADHACPKFPGGAGSQAHQSSDFAQGVLTPRAEQ
jgi:hypothetical protein